ncbi:MAG: DNA cytosine methyltransferase [Acidobacteriota bacterium]|nr:DNA cytosine methyltransferase [Acidobacteriota bacterium]
MAELAGIPQRILSAFELEKAGLSSGHQETLREILSRPWRHQDIIDRKKRYRRHSYTYSGRRSERAELVRQSENNAGYLMALDTLSTDKRKAFTGLSLFAGGGGFSLGMSSAGCEILGFIEIDDGLASTYSANFPHVKRVGSDVRRLGPEEIGSIGRELGVVDVLFGGPPCQGFSLSGKRDAADNRNYLFKDLMRFVEVLSPKVVILENVRLLTSMRSTNGRFVKDVIVEELRSRGYEARLHSVDACRYGVPQHRERVFFVAVRSDLGVSPTFPEPQYDMTPTLFLKAARTFGDACSDLEYIESGQMTADPLHAAVRHPDHVIRWLWDVPEGQSAHKNNDPTLRPPSGYNTTYKRQVWNEPGATVQTTFSMISGCRTVHPIATRALTAREAARLQSFPDSYRFEGRLGTVRKAIGNAVPPLLALTIGKHLRTELLDLVEVPCL